MPYYNQTLRPFRDYNEKDVINFFTVSGVIPNTGAYIDQVIPQGTLVSLNTANGAVGFQNDQDEPNQMLGNFGGYNVNNFVAQRYGTTATVVVAFSTDPVGPLGMTLFDMREVDENGEILRYRPQKAAEMEAVISGYTVPIVTRGIFLYSGVTTGTGGLGVAIQVGHPAYAGDNGCVCTTGTNKVGVFLSASGQNTNYIVGQNIALIKFAF